MFFYSNLMGHPVHTHTHIDHPPIVTCVSKRGPRHTHGWISASYVCGGQVRTCVAGVCFPDRARRRYGCRVWQSQHRLRRAVAPLSFVFCRSCCGPCSGNRTTVCPACLDGVGVISNLSFRDVAACFPGCNIAFIRRTVSPSFIHTCRNSTHEVERCRREAREEDDTGRWTCYESRNDEPTWSSAVRSHRRAAIWRDDSRRVFSTRLDYVTREFLFDVDGRWLLSAFGVRVKCTEESYVERGEE